MRILLFLLLFTSAAAAADVRPLKLATGELLVHAFQGGVPLPAESRWTICQNAGPTFVPEGGQYRLHWSIILKPRGSSAQLRGITRVTMQEVVGSKAVQIFDGRAEVTDKGIVLMAPEHLVSRERYPWLYSSEPTLLVLRVSLFRAGEQDTLLQPVLIGTGVKRTLKDGGYLQ
jgi:hypothetical protein